MADSKHVERIRLWSTGEWNAWREENPSLRPDLSGADISYCAPVRVSLEAINLRHANLRDANLSGHTLIGASFQGANLQGTDLSGCLLDAADFTTASLTAANLAESRLISASLVDANLGQACLRRANLDWVRAWDARFRGADLSESSLVFADLRGAELLGANLANAILARTSFVDANIGGATGLDRSRYVSRCFVDHASIARASPLPVEFVQGCDLSAAYLDFVARCSSTPQGDSCFVIHSDDDEIFAQRLCSDLESEEVRCWCVPGMLEGPGPTLLHDWNDLVDRRKTILVILDESEPNFFEDWGFKDSDAESFVWIGSAAVDEAHWGERLQPRIRTIDRQTSGERYRQDFERLLRNVFPKSVR